MYPVDDVGVAISDVYAKALLKLAGDTGAPGALVTELEEFIDYVNSTPDFEEFLAGDRVDASTRRAVLEKTLRGKCSDLLLNALQVLNNKGRLPLLEQVGRQCRLAYESLLNQVQVTVRSAVPLEDKARESLLAALKRYTGADPVLTEEVDASLIGGLVVHVGDEKIDFSVTKKLQRLREAFIVRASQEIHGGRAHLEKA